LLSSYRSTVDLHDIVPFWNRGVESLLSIASHDVNRQNSGTSLPKYPTSVIPQILRTDLHFLPHGMLGGIRLPACAAIQMFHPDPNSESKTPGTSRPTDGTLSSLQCANASDTTTPVARRHAVARLLNRRFFAIAALIVCVLTVTGAVIRDRNPIELELFPVQPSTYRDSLELKGAVESVRTERVASTCRWTTQILSIVPEGTWVQKGDVVCVLDSADVEEFLRGREVLLIRARAGLETSVQEELLQKSRSERLLSQAQFRLQDADLRLKEYVHGTWPQQLDDLDRSLQMAEDRNDNAQQDFEFSEQLWLQGHTNSRSFRQASVDALYSRLAVNTLKGERNLLTEFTHPQRQMQMEYGSTDAERELLRTQIATSIAETRSRLGTMADERRAAIYERQVETARSSLEACTLRAPRDGQVIHANSWYWRSRGRKAIEVGRTVKWQQSIFNIPDSDQFKVNVPLDETLITKVYRGMPATVRLTGFEDVEIVAEIGHISHYPRARSAYIPGVRDYWLDVVLDPTEEQRQVIRNQADASATLVLKEKRDALMIPQTAVARVAGHNFVWRMQGVKLVAQPVELGDVQDGRVMVTEGLHAGDRVALELSPQHREALEQRFGDQTTRLYPNSL
jgi:HlyD family secretion protein